MIPENELRNAVLDTTLGMPTFARIEKGGNLGGDFSCELNTPEKNNNRIIKQCFTFNKRD